jgi:hypothetical protein
MVMGQVLGDLTRLAVRPMSLLAMVALLAFSVGYSIFIGEMTRGGGTESALRFAGLNQLYGVLSATLGAVIVFVLSRRYVHDDDAEAAGSRLGAFVALSFGMFLMAQFVQLIWPPIVMLTMPVPDRWFATAMRLPALALVVLLFPLSVWRVGLACGARRPTFSETWRKVWKTQRLPIAGAFLLTVVGLLLLQVMQPLAVTEPGLSRVVGLTLLLGPSAVTAILQVLLAIIAFRRILPTESQRVAEVFA